MCCPFWAEISTYYVTYRPTQVNDNQGSKEYPKKIVMKKFTKPKCNLCIEEHLTILKKFCDKCVTVMNKNLEIYGAFSHNNVPSIFPKYWWYCLSCKGVKSYNFFKTLEFENINYRFSTEIFLLILQGSEINQLRQTKVNHNCC